MGLHGRGLLLCPLLFLLSLPPLAAARPVTDFLRLPEGFVAEVLVSGLDDARSMALGEEGTLFVGTRRAGHVYAVRDVLGGKPQVIRLLTGLKMPNGVALHEGALYVAEPRRILRLPDVEARLDAPPQPEVVVDDLPFKGMLHAWKYIAFGPDGYLYVPIGAPCNVCENNEFGIFLRMKPDGSAREVYATGVRNSVGFTWHPRTAELWFTDNGRDLMGDDIPPCELNRAPRAGLDFGFPYCHGGVVPDPEFGALGRCEDAVPPVQALAPHSAPLGVRFYTGTMFPAEYRGQVLIAEHGSWNRSKAAGPTGYRITRVTLEGHVATAYQPFIEGWARDGEVHGRPVDLLVAPDGALLVSDDKAGVIYRISYRHRR